MLVGKRLCQVASHTILSVLEGVDGEETDMFERHTVSSIKEDT